MQTCCMHLIRLVKKHKYASGAMVQWVRVLVRVISCREHAENYRRLRFPCRLAK